MGPGNKRAKLSPDPYTYSDQNSSNNNDYSSNAAQQHTPLYPAPSSTTSTTPAATATISASSFRNVSACNRCRLRKNRCDQSLPACASCQKAGAKCVGFDPITRREIPRSYVYFLESRVAYLEGELGKRGIAVESAEADGGWERDITSQTGDDGVGGFVGADGRGAGQSKKKRGSGTLAESGNGDGGEWGDKREESDKLNTLVSNIGMVSVQGASDPRYLGSTSGISFARVVFAAVKSSVTDKNGGKRNSSIASSAAGAAAAATSGGPSMRDSFFGLQSKPNFKPAPWPERELGARLVELYFEHANPQIPILHRGDFMAMFGRAYAVGKERRRNARELYMLNIVFAIGAGTILLESNDRNGSDPIGKTAMETEVKQEPVSPTTKRARMASLQRQPEEYHSSAMMHLESFLGSMPTSSTADKFEGSGGSLEQLQAVLLLAGFALLRPVAPGLWYIVGVAMRLGVDLGLHYEDGAGAESAVTRAVGNLNVGAEQVQGLDPNERGRREWVRDLRRRLWWCVYSFDRLVSTCVGRPFGITDQVITTEWPSILDDKDITPAGFLASSHNFNGPSYKRVSHHYFRLRLLQSEILQVLQYRQAQRVHERDRGVSNQYMHTTLSSSFLQPFGGSFPAWRADIDLRLWLWKEGAPMHKDTSVGFNVKFLELNYWQAVIMLYRQSLSVPTQLAAEKGPHNDVESPLTSHTDDHEDEDEIFLKVAEAGQRVLKLYKELHRVGLVNYTYLATVHLFMAGIAFLYSIWHSPTVRARLTLEDVDYTVLAATSVLSDLTSKCPPAEACRDAFDRMAKATIKMCQSTTGFGSQIRFMQERLDDSPLISSGDFEKQIPISAFPGSRVRNNSRPAPQFDYNLKDLFTENSMPVRSFNSTNNSGSGSSTSNQFMPSNPSTSNQFPYPSPASTNTSLATSNPTSNPAPTFRQPSYATQSSHQQQNHIQNYSPLDQPQQQQQQYDPRLLSSAITMPPTTATAAPDYDPIFDLSTSTDLEFLMSHHDSMPPTYTGDAVSGLDLGFDGRSDWTGTGEMPNLFGEFFFGGAGMGGMEGVEGMEYADGGGEEGGWK